MIKPTSLTLAWGGPVYIRPPYFLKKLNESLFFKYDSARMDLLFEKIAPAYFVFPSIPSVPIDVIMNKFLSFFNSLAIRKTNSWFLPPLPVPITFNVG